MTTKSRINPWIIVWLCFATLAIVMSARQSVSIMTDEWVRTLGWSKTFIGSGQAIALVVIAIVAPITGNLADRHGVRSLLAGGLVAIAIGLAIFAAFPVAAFYIIGYSLVGGVGFASASYHLISTAVARALHREAGAGHRHCQCGQHRRAIHHRATCSLSSSPGFPGAGALPPPPLPASPWPPPFGSS